jgi:DNA mismatch repair protein MutL
LPGKIVVLPEALINKIAAGEVIERPASIVKELLENSLDAGATDVTVELENGGRESIRVIDNGEGMDDADALIAFERHATSKIYEFDDLYKVKSFGFRGEALPSIASISRVEMITRRQSALTGCRIVVESGKALEATAAGCPAGTSVFVEHIFDSVPVRKKFLKASNTEQGHCLDVITRMAISHPGVKIKVIAKGKTILNVPATNDELERISLILGTDFTEQILSVKAQENSIRIEGFISKPESTRASAKHMYYYVNKRFVRDYLINHAVMTAYTRVIEPRRYPCVVLFVDLPADDVDVNVHPTKMEVRFRDPHSVYNGIAKIISAVLAGASPVPRTPSFATSGRGGKAGLYQPRIEEALKRYTVISGGDKLLFDKNFAQRASQIGDAPAGVIPAFAENEKSDAGKITFADLKYIGQADGTYLIFSSAQGILIMDQHAAHERILFEKLRNEAAPDAAVAAQRLLIPEILSLSPKDFSLLTSNRQSFAEAGIEIEPFGSGSVAVKSMPVLLAHCAPREVIIDMLEEWGDAGGLSDPKDKKERIFALLACKGAVKAHQSLSPAEVATLCKDLDACPFSSTCPHGRPVYVCFGYADMEKMFKRR